MGKKECLEKQYNLDALPLVDKLINDCIIWNIFLWSFKSSHIILEMKMIVWLSQVKMDICILSQRTAVL